MLAEPIIAALREGFAKAKPKPEPKPEPKTETTASLKEWLAGLSDDEQGILDPIGMSGIRLEANFHIITGQITAIKNLQKCVEKASLEIPN
jgi:hypothetical protein